MNLLSIVVFSVLVLLNACESSQKVEAPGYTLQKRHMLPDKIQETSGLIVYNGLVWTFNDSGGKAEIYGFNLSTDSIEQTITLANSRNEDWEDIAQDEKYIYIGDFGNNQGMRDSLVIYKVAKSSIPAKGNGTVNPGRIVFGYPEYKAVTIAVSWSAFDCEAFVAFGDSLYLFTKDWTNGTSTIYSLPKTTGTFMARKHQTLNVEGLVTGADYSDKQLVLIGYSSFVPFIIKYAVSDIKKVTDKTGVRFDLEEIATYQTEGICFSENGLLISSEKTRSPAQIIELKID